MLLHRILYNTIEIIHHMSAMANHWRKLCFILLSLFCLQISVADDTRYTYNPKTVEKRFQQWAVKNGKQYKSNGEWMLRLGIYHANLEYIELKNSQNLSYKLGDNQFADLTNDEFLSMYAGRLDLLQQSAARRNQSTTTSKLRLSQGDPPAAIDWVEKGAVTPVKNQGNCGSCWAFSTIAAVEGITQIKTGELIELSEQELVDCDKGYNMGCNGGLMDKAFEYIKKNGGIATEEDYPYKAADGNCTATKNKSGVITGYENVPSNDEAALLAAVAGQPVSVALEAGYDLQLYKSGIFTGECGKMLNHGVTIVGYGAEGDQMFWKFKNSWGEKWGESGYMRIIRGTNDTEGTCGIAMLPSYPVMEK